MMIGDDWLKVTDHQGEPRIGDPLDWIRLEIKSALARDVQLIPVLVEDSVMPRPGELPEDIRELAFRNGAELRVESWTQDFDRLAAALPSPSAPPTSQGRRERAKIDFVAARAFIESIPPGRWTSYGEVSRSGGSPTGAMAIGTWLLTKGDMLPNMWRVLNRHGEVSDGWAPTNPELPQDPEGVRELLESEGVAFDERARADKGQLWTATDAAEAGVPVVDREVG